MDETPAPTLHTPTADGKDDGSVPEFTPPPAETGQSEVEGKPTKGEPTTTIEFTPPPAETGPSEVKEPTTTTECFAKRKSYPPWIGVTGQPTDCVGSTAKVQIDDALMPVKHMWSSIAETFFGSSGIGRVRHLPSDEERIKHIRDLLLMTNKATWKKIVKVIYDAGHLTHAEEVAKQHKSQIFKQIEENPGCRGLALIVTNEYSTTKHPLKGTKKDEEMLRKVFEAPDVKFAVCSLKNGTCSQFTKLISEVKELQYEQVNDFQCILVAFSGHGKERDKIIMNDNEELSIIDEILTPLQPEKARELARIPKVILIDACRGSEPVRTILTPGSPSKGFDHKNIRIAPEGNYLLARATMEGYKAYIKSEESGSVWFNALATQLKTSAQDLERVLTDTNQVMVEEYQNCEGKFQQPYRVSTLNRPVFIRNPEGQSNKP